MIQIGLFFFSRICRFKSYPVTCAIPPSAFQTIYITRQFRTPDHAYLACEYWRTQDEVTKRALLTPLLFFYFYTFFLFFGRCMKKSPPLCFRGGISKTEFVRRQSGKETGRLDTFLLPPPFPLSLSLFLIPFYFPLFSSCFSPLIPKILCTNTFLRFPISSGLLATGGGVYYLMVFSSSSSSNAIFASLRVPSSPSLRSLFSFVIMPTERAFFF